MPCPCCGLKREINSLECTACGARQVGPPLAPPDVLLPRLGPAFAALACAIVVLVAFLAVWIFGNDMKVGRVFLVWVFGDGLKFTRDLLQVDAKLPYYRIFSYDAYRLAFIFSLGAIPLSLLGVQLARRAGQLIKRDPAGFAGLRLARFSLALSACLLVGFSAVTVTAIPGAIERGRAKRMAATRALMYELHAQALQRYYDKYRTYPKDLSDLARINAATAPQSDYWENNFAYRPVGVIASRGSAISLSNYKLISAGPDGKFGTKDDITMIDGVVIDAPTDPTTVEEWSATKKPLQ